MLTWKEYREIRKAQFGENRTESKYNFKRYLEFQMKNHPIVDCYVETAPSQRESYLESFLGNCTAATPCVRNMYEIQRMESKQEEGINPMITKNSAAISGSSIIIEQSDAPKSDAMIQRDYLMSELKRMTSNNWREDTWQAKTDGLLRKQFNIDAPMYPQTSQALLDAFAKNEFTVDAVKLAKQAKAIADGREYDDDEYVMSKFYGITFTGLPVEDRKSFGLALDARSAAVKATERTIQIGTPADGLAALMALEAWTYTAPAAA